MLALSVFASLTLAMAPVQEAVSQPSPAAAAATATIIAQRTDRAPEIDGRDDDVVWRDAMRVSDFIQFDPTEGTAPSFRTELRVAYDERNLYVHVRAHDPHPDSIVRALSRRDTRGPSDQIIVMVDSYNDRRTGFEFAVNPDGVKRDYAIYNDTDEDGSWNAVWHVATLVDSLGWAAEYRIPLSQLRYPDAPEHTFGFSVWRDIERYRERVSWPAYSRNRHGFASQFGTLSGLTGLSGSRSVELSPYTVAKSEPRASASGGFDRTTALAFGADLKLRATPNITLDATVNPDFGQVEADPAVLNLSAFETFLSERRPFFVEGTGLYRFALNCYIVVDCGTNEGLFYSRRIGRAPALRDRYGDPTTPTATPIAAAAKLTGRTRNGLSFGLLNAVTQRVAGLEDATAEPRANYAVLSAEQDLRGGQAGVRVIATAVNRWLDESTRPFMHESAYAAGLSGRVRLFGGNYELAGSIAASRMAGDAAAIARTQQSAVHYYQQPDAELAFDNTRTSLWGHAEQLKLGKYGGGITRFETSFVRQSAGFDVNDLGYLRRADRQNWSTWANLTFNTPRRLYRWLRINGNHWQTWNTSGRRLESAINANAHMGLHNNWDLHAGATLDALGESFCDRCTRGGPALRRSHGFNPWFGVNADSRRLLVPSLWMSFGYRDGGRSHNVSLDPSLTLRFSTQMEVRLGANISRNRDDAQWFGNFTDEDDVIHYAFARLDQRTVSMNLRARYTARPNLTLELYGEPFVSRGTYSSIREASAPYAEDHDARFTPFTPPATADTAFRVRQLRANAVARWEYLPGSTLFLVWTHGRQAYGAERSERSWSREYGGLFELYPENTFLIKLSYWLNR